MTTPAFARSGISMLAARHLGSRSPTICRNTMSFRDNRRRIPCTVRVWEMRKGIVVKLVLVWHALRPQRCREKISMIIVWKLDRQLGQPRSYTRKRQEPWYRTSADLCSDRRRSEDLAKRRYL